LVRRKRAAQIDGRMGVSPPSAGVVSQKKRTKRGCSGHCAISWWKGMSSEGGASFAV